MPTASKPTAESVKTTGPGCPGPAYDWILPKRRSGAHVVRIDQAHTGDGDPGRDVAGHRVREPGEAVQVRRGPGNAGAASAHRRRLRAVGFAAARALTRDRRAVRR